MFHLLLRIPDLGGLSSSRTGAKATTTGWATGPTITSGDPGRCRAYRGRRSSPSPPALCTACAALRMVRPGYRGPGAGIQLWGDLGWEPLPSEDPPLSLSWLALIVNRAAAWPEMLSGLGWARIWGLLQVTCL